LIVEELTVAQVAIDSGSNLPAVSVQGATPLQRVVIKSDLSLDEKVYHSAAYLRENKFHH